MPQRITPSEEAFVKELLSQFVLDYASVFEQKEFDQNIAVAAMLRHFESKYVKKWAMRLFNWDKEVAKKRIKIASKMLKDVKEKTNEK